MHIEFTHVTGQEERTIRTIESLIGANMADGLTFEESVNLAIKTIRQNPHSKLNMTPFQMHFGRKPRTAITNLIGRPECLLSNWKKTLTNYVLAQPNELQMFTVNDSEGEMADYMVLNDSKKRARSVSREFKQYQFFEKEIKPNAMKNRFKTNKMLTAVKETQYTVTTPEGKIIHKKLASKPIKFQLPKKPEERRKPTNRCIKCGKFSQGDYCDTHKRVYGVPKDTDEPSSSNTLPTMPQKRSTYGDITATATETDSPPAEGEEQQTDATITVTETQPTEDTPGTNTPLPSTLVQCSTSHGTRPTQPEDGSQTPIRATVRAEVTRKKEIASPKKGKLKTIEKNQKTIKYISNHQRIQ